MSSYQSSSSMCNQKGGGSFPQRYYKTDTQTTQRGGGSFPQRYYDPTHIRQTGGGSFSTLANAAGPVNYPDNGWMNGEDLFRAFNPTGTYIPASQLNQASVLTDGILGTKLTGGAKKKNLLKRKQLLKNLLLKRKQLLKNLLLKRKQLLKRKL